MDFKRFKELFEKREVKEYPNRTPGNPIVSVCIQTFNQSGFIEKCLDGIIQQKTNFPIEILLSDDESTDGTFETCLKYSKKFPDIIRLFSHSRKNNIKVLNTPTANFTSLFNLYNCKGKYIAICEGDDYWVDPLKLQKQFNFLEENKDFSICYHNFKIINDKDHEIDSKKAIPLQKDLTKDNLILGKEHPATLTIFFRSIINSFPIEMTRVINMDVFLYSLLGQYGNGKYLRDIQPACYRVHGNGLWSTIKNENRYFSKINTFTELYTFYLKKDNKNTAKKFKKRILETYNTLILFYLKNHKLHKAISIYKDSLLTRFTY